MKKTIRLTESDLMRIVKRVINEQSKPIVKEGVGTGILVLTGVGLLYLGRKIKKFIDKTAKFMPSVTLGAFLSKIKSIEDGKVDGKVLVKDKGNYKIIAIIIDGKVFDSLTIDMENDEIFSGHKGLDEKGPSQSDRVVPMTMPRDADQGDIEEIKAMEEELVNQILSVIDRYGEPKE